MVASPPAKRQRVTPLKDAAKKAGVPTETVHMWSALHQFTIVGGPAPPEGYDSKQRRLEHILERLPGGGGSAIVFASKADIVEVQSIVNRHCRTEVTGDLALLGKSNIDWKLDTLSNASTRVSTNCSDSDASLASFESVSDSGGEASNEETSVAEQVQSLGPPTVHVSLPNYQAFATSCADDCQYVINYSFPTSGRKYIESFSKILKYRAGACVVFTMVEEEELRIRRCREVMGLIRRARQAALQHESIAGLGKATELLSCMQQLNPDHDEEDDDEDDEDDDGRCQCAHCQSYSLASMTFHAPNIRGTPRVEAVYIHISALDNLQAVAPLIQPRLQDHVCTVICHHCLYEHAPWAGSERYFALPEGMGSVRAVFVLAEDASYHTYPDTGTFYGGSAWIDILDMASMDKTDKLLENLVDHEIDLLKGRSDRVVLFGVSQGAGQSMLRFLRSRHKLGGWVGGVGHVPTTPHTPRDRDPLTDAWRPLVNLNRPIRFLSGGKDSTFPPAMVQRDAERLQKVGGFTDVQVEMQPELSHEGWLGHLEPMRGGQTSNQAKKRKEVQSAEDSLKEDVPDLCYLRQQLPSILGLTCKR